MTPLTTIEEQEDRRIMENAQNQLRKESLSHGEKEEIDVGRTMTLSPDSERPEQVLPNVTVQGSNDGSSDSERTATMEMNERGFIGFMDRKIVESPEEISLGTKEREIVVQEDGIFMKRHVEV